MGDDAAGLRHLIRTSKQLSTEASELWETAYRTEDEDEAERLSDRAAEIESKAEAIRTEYTELTGISFNRDGDPDPYVIGEGGLTATDPSTLASAGFDPTLMTAAEQQEAHAELAEREEDERAEQFEEAAKEYIAEVLDVDTSGLDDDQLRALVKKNQGAFDLDYAKETGELGHIEEVLGVDMSELEFDEVKQLVEANAAKFEQFDARQLGVADMDIDPDAFTPEEVARLEGIKADVNTELALNVPEGLEGKIVRADGTGFGDLAGEGGGAPNEPGSHDDVDGARSRGTSPGDDGGAADAAARHGAATPTIEGGGTKPDNARDGAGPVDTNAVGEPAEAGQAPAPVPAPSDLVPEHGDATTDGGIPTSHGDGAGTIGGMRNSPDRAGGSEMPSDGIEVEGEAVATVSGTGAADGAGRPSDAGTDLGPGGEGGGAMSDGDVAVEILEWVSDGEPVDGEVPMKPSVVQDAAGNLYHGDGTPFTDEETEAFHAETGGDDPEGASDDFSPDGYITPKDGDGGGPDDGGDSTDDDTADGSSSGSDEQGSSDDGDDGSSGDDDDGSSDDGSSGSDGSSGDDTDGDGSTEAADDASADAADDAEDTAEDRGPEGDVVRDIADTLNDPSFQIRVAADRTGDVNPDPMASGLDSSAPPITQRSGAPGPDVVVNPGEQETLVREADVEAQLAVSDYGQGAIDYGDDGPPDLPDDQGGPAPDTPDPVTSGSLQAHEPLDAVAGALESDAVGEIGGLADVAGLDPAAGVQDAIGGEAGDATDEFGD